MRAILIDDELLTLDFLERKLNQLSKINVIGKYTNPHEGLIAVIKEEPDIVFLDIEMPETTGMTLAKEIQKAFPTIKIVFVTGFEEYAVNAFELQVEDYVLKPFDDERLMKTIARISNHTMKKMTKQIKMICCFQQLSFTYYGTKQEAIDVNWRTSKARELFAFLVHHRGQFVRKDIILEHFWADSTIKNAYAQLYSTIYQIRKSLATVDFNIKIISSDNSYKLELNDVVTDVDLWKKDLEEIPFVTKENIKRHKELLELYRGDYFEEEGYLWAENEKNRLHVDWLDHLMKIADYYINIEKYGEAIILYLKMQKILPYKEESYFKLMKLYHTFGDRYSVMDQYKRLKGMLNEEYGTEPSQEIEQWFKEWEQAQAKK